MTNRKARAQQTGRLMNRLTHRIAGRIPSKQATRISGSYQSLAVQGPQRATVACAGEDKLVSASETGLKVGQDRSDQDTKVGLGDRPEDPHRNSRLDRAQVDISRKVVNGRTVAAVRCDDFLTHPALHRGEIDGVMTSDTDADGHVLRAHSR